MTPAEFTARMRILRARGGEDGWAGDTEALHSEADELLVEALKGMGFEEGLKAYEELGKWYA